MTKKTQYAIVGYLTLNNSGAKMTVTGVVSVDEAPDADKVAEKKFTAQLLGTRDSRGRTYLELGKVTITRTMKVVGHRDYIELVEGK